MTAILQYHQIANLPAGLDRKRLAVAPAAFERQMVSLYRSGFRCLPLHDVVSSLLDGRRLPSRSFALTFDDGFRDIQTTAWPILARLGFTATVFLVTERVGLTSSWDGEESAAPLLSWDEVSALFQAGLTFGSHTMTHSRVTRLPVPDARREIRGSRVILEQRIGAPVEFFAYPYSDRNESVQKLVAEGGYLAALAGDRGPWSRYSLWRAQCTADDTPFTVRAKAAGWYDRLTWVREESVLARFRPLLGSLKARAAKGNSSAI